MCARNLISGTCMCTGRPVYISSVLGHMGALVHVSLDHNWSQASKHIKLSVMYYTVVSRASAHSWVSAHVTILAARKKSAHSRASVQVANMTQDDTSSAQPTSLVWPTLACRWSWFFLWSWQVTSLDFQAYKTVLSLYLLHFAKKANVLYRERAYECVRVPS